MKEIPNIGVFLRQAVAISAVVFFCVGSLLLYRISQLMKTSQQLVADVSQDVKAVTGEVVKVSREVENLRGDLREYSERIKESSPVEYVDNLLDIDKAIREGEERAKNLTPERDEEIRHLLNSVFWAKEKFNINGAIRRPSTMYANLLTKRKALARGIGNAEDFITVCGTKSISGNTYYIIENETKNKQLLRDWLMQKLKEYRITKKPAAAPYKMKEDKNTEERPTCIQQDGEPTE